MALSIIELDGLTQCGTLMRESVHVPHPQIRTVTEHFQSAPLELVLERTMKPQKREVWVEGDPSTRYDLSRSRLDLYRYVLQVVNLLRPLGGIPARGGSSYDPR